MISSKDIVREIGHGFGCHPMNFGRTSSTYNLRVLSGNLGLVVVNIYVQDSILGHEEQPDLCTQEPVSGPPEASRRMESIALSFGML